LVPSDALYHDLEPQKVLEPCADFSRKAAKAQSAAAFQQSSLHLCAFAWESFFSQENLKYFLCKAPFGFNL
jgi:hypothetical protein